MAPFPPLTTPDPNTQTLTSPSVSPHSTHRTTPPTSTPPTQPSPSHSHDSTSDVFASRSPSPVTHHHPRHHSQEPSDLPALKRQHITTGYRAGLSAGKDTAETAQAGFDDGFPVGAELGLRVGWILGWLRDLSRGSAEGKAKGTSGGGNESEEGERGGSGVGDGGGNRTEGDGVDVQALLERAEEELKLEALATAPEFSGEEDLEEREEVVRWDVVNGWIEKVREVGRGRGLELEWREVGPG